jgi:hypothetical protein
VKETHWSHRSKLVCWLEESNANSAKAKLLDAIFAKQRHIIEAWELDDDSPTSPASFIASCC